MRLLIAVVTCRKFADRANVQRCTWAQDALAAGADVRFFVGDGSSVVADDTVQLLVSDDYEHLPRKVQLMFGWAVSQGYDVILKTDDDTLVRPQEFAEFMKWRSKDYIGSRNGDTQYCSGFGYILSSKAARIVSQAIGSSDWAEDRWVGSVLRENGIVLDDSPYFLYSRWPARCKEHRRCGWENCPDCVNVKKNFIVFCPINKLHEVDDLYRRAKDEYEKCSGDSDS